MSQYPTPTVTPVAIGVHMALKLMRHETQVRRALDRLGDTSPASKPQGPARAEAVAPEPSRGET